MSTGRKWSKKEENLHINVLELIAVKFVILKFTKGQPNIAIHLQIDNNTALSYLLKMVGTHSRKLLHISKSIWSYFLSKKNVMSEEYLSSALNVHADWGSRNAKANSEWKIDVSFFQKIVTHVGQHSGCVCIQNLPPTSSIHCMKTRLRQYGNRCIPSSLRQGLKFCFSSIQLDKSCPKEDHTRKNKLSNHSDTHMKNSPLVCTTSKNVCTVTISSASDKKFVINSTGRKSSSSKNRVFEISGVEGFRQSL